MTATLDEPSIQIQKNHVYFCNHCPIMINDCSLMLLLGNCVFLLDAFIPFNHLCVLLFKIPILSTMAFNDVVFAETRLIGILRAILILVIYWEKTTTYISFKTDLFLVVQETLTSPVWFVKDIRPCNGSLGLSTYAKEIPKITG